jgi:glyoxylase I family protein
MIHGVHHPAISVPDIQQALDFYCGVLGFEVVMEVDLPAGVMEEPFGIESAACKIRMVTKGGTCIEMFEFESAPEGDPQRPVSRHGITHIALASDDVPGDYATLLAAGVQFNTPVQGESPQQWCYGRDPFGNVLELLEVPTPG